MRSSEFDPPAAAAPPAIDASGTRLSDYKRPGLTLALLTAAYFFSHMDRSILAILQEQIKADLRLSDTQLGLLAGFAFAMFYATLGIPVARLADRYNRTNIIVISLTLWSAMTALGGLAQNFTHMLLARIGVGIGEAGSSPPSHSIISDLYPPSRRAGAMSIYSLGIVLGGGLGATIGGVVAHAYDWRVAMYTVGLPGIVLAVVIKLLVVEPRRGMSDPVAVAPRHDEPMPGIGDGFRSMAGNRTVVHLLLAVSFSTIVAYGNGSFVPSYLQRSLGVKLIDLALVFAPLYALVGGIAAVLGGWVANRVASRWGLYAQCYLIVALKLLAVVPNIAAYLATTANTAMVGFMLDAFLTSSYLGTTFALIQGLAPIRMRALWASITLLVISLIGGGVGPTLVGALSEHFHAALGKESLRYAMLGMQVLVPVQALFFWLAGRALSRTAFGQTRT